MKTETALKTLSERQILNRLNHMDAINAEIKALKTESDRIRAELIASLGQCDIDNDRFRVKYTEYTEKGIDTAKLKKELPDLWDMFPKTTTKSRFTYSVM